MAQLIQRSFTSGELAPSLYARADLEKYRTGLALCQNFFIRSQGGAYSRPGFRFVDEVGDSSRRARLIPFSFSTEQTYVLVFEHMTLRFIQDGAYVMNGGSPYEIATPYSEDELSRLTYTQSADVMTICHPEHDPRDLNRLGQTNWELVVLDFEPTVGEPQWADNPGVVIVSNITAANPAVVTTLFPHPFDNGDTIQLTGDSNFDQIDNRFFVVRNKTSNTFELEDTDTTGLGTFTFSGSYLASGLSAIQPDGPPQSGGTYTKTYAYVLTAVDADGAGS